MTAAQKPLTEWLNYISAVHPHTIELGLQRIAKVAKQLECQHFTCPVITVAGTNGKGSTVTTLATVYAAAGYRVGAYTSPHIWRYNERIQLNGKPVSDEQICAAFATIEAARGTTPLTYFEFGTLAALLIFQSAACDVVILEVGLGGRLDATNIVDADIAVITTIALDHQAWLGYDIESIGKEKAGIMRHGHPVVCADTVMPASVLEHARTLNAPLYQLGHDFHCELLGETWWWRSAHQQQLYPLPQLKLSNVAAALQVIELLQATCPVSTDVIAKTLPQCRLTGRGEISVEGNLTVIRDVAHNAQSIQHFAEYVRALALPGSHYALFSCYEDKLSKDLLAPLSQWISAWYVAPMQSSRSASATQLQQLLTDHSVLATQQHRFDALSQAHAALRERVSTQASASVLLLFGSFGFLKELYSPLDA